MATQTLAQAALLINNEIVAGVAEDIITINPMFSFMPFIGYEGQGIIVNRELSLGGADEFSVGATISAAAKAAATFTRKTFLATKIIGDAEMDGLVQAESVGAGVDQLALELSLKAKNVGRLFQNGMANGTGTSPQMNSLDSLCDSGQYTTTAATVVNLSLLLMDELLDLVKSKDGEADWIMMPARTLRSLKVLYRALGGAMPSDVLVMPDGTSRTVYKYEDIPVFKNEYLSTEELLNATGLTGGTGTSVWAGVWDDGSRKLGLAAIHPVAVPGGIVVHPVGYKEDKDEEIWRVKQYANVALFNGKGLARLHSIKD